MSTAAPSRRPVNWKLRVPELESLSRTYTAKNLNGLHGLRELPTCFNLIEVPSVTGVKHNVVPKVPLTPEGLEETIKFATNDTLSLRVIVLEQPQIPAVGPSTSAPGSANFEPVGWIRWMAEKLGVSPCFFDCVLSASESTVIALPDDSPPNIDQGNTDETTTPRDRTYNGVYISQITGMSTTVWFSHTLRNTSDTSHGFSTYIIHNLSPVTTKALLSFLVTAPTRSARPSFVSVDAIVLNDDQLFYETYSDAYRGAVAGLSSIEAQSGRLHHTGKDKKDYEVVMGKYEIVHVVDRAYSTKERIITLLKEMNQHFKHNSHGQHPDLRVDMLLSNMENSVHVRKAVIDDSLDMLKTKMSVQMSMYSAQIAEDARRDSSSMTAIAVVTLMFLPGSFLAAFFSTSFVKDVEFGEEGGKRTSVLPLQLSPAIWVYVVTTAFLTAVVLFVWAYLRGRLFAVRLVQWLEANALSLKKSLAEWIRDVRKVGRPQPSDTEKSE